MNDILPIWTLWAGHIRAAPRFLRLEIQPGPPVPEAGIELSYHSNTVGRRHVGEEAEVGEKFDVSRAGGVILEVVPGLPILGDRETRVRTGDRGFQISSSIQTQLG